MKTLVHAILFNILIFSSTTAKNISVKSGQKYNLIKNLSLDKIPDFYFSIIYDLESEDPQRENAARKIMFEH